MSFFVNYISSDCKSFPVKEENRVTKWLVFIVWFPTHMFSPLGFCEKEKVWFFVWLSKLGKWKPICCCLFTKGIFWCLFFTLDLFRISIKPVVPWSLFLIPPLGVQHPSLQWEYPWNHSLPSLVLAFPSPWRIAVNFSQFSRKNKALVKKNLVVSPTLSCVPLDFSSLGIPGSAFPSKLCVQQDRAVLCWTPTSWAHPLVLALGSWEGFPTSAPPAMRCWGTALGY